MEADKLRLMSKKEAKEITLGDKVTFRGFWGKDNSYEIHYNEPKMTPGKEYEIKSLSIPHEKKDNITFIVNDDAGDKRYIHRRFFGVKKF